MKKYKIFSFVLFCIILIGCKTEKKDNNNNVIVDEFPITKEIQGECINTIKAFNIFDIDVRDTFLVVVNDKENSMLQIYSTTSYKLLDKFSGKGKGPGEFIMPNITRQLSFSNNKNNAFVYVCDPNRKRITKINLTESINQSKYTYSSKKVPKELEHFIRIFYVSDSLICYEPEGSRFTLYDSINKIRHNVPYCTPDPGFSIPKDNEYFIYRSAISLNKDKKKVAAAPLLIGQLDFFDFKGNYRFTTTFEEKKNLKQGLQSKNVTQSSHTKRYIKTLESTDDLIFALNENMPYVNEDVKKTNSEILIFNWEGKPVKKILLDRYVKEFALDNKQNIIYAFCPYENNFTIVKYKLGENSI